MKLRELYINNVNRIYGITLFCLGIIASFFVEVEPGVHDLTCFVICATFGFLSIFFLKPSDFDLYSKYRR